MALTTRAGKGSALTHNEMDTNWSLVQPDLDTETAGRALVADDRRIAHNNSSTGTFTLAAGVSIYEIAFYQIGTGGISLTPASGVTVNGVDGATSGTIVLTNVQYSTAVLTWLSANTYMVS